MDPTCSRRCFLASLGAIGGGSLLASGPAASALDGGGGSVRLDGRRYHLCLASGEIARAPELLAIVREAGVTDIWLASYLYGFWIAPPEEIVATARLVESHGLVPHVINVPLGHPGDALGAREGDVPTSPPEHWRLARRLDGSAYSGTSVHAPAEEENCVAVRRLERTGAREIFLDDDFRIAQSPGIVGGCFCDDCRQRFLEAYGWGAGHWATLAESIAQRRLSPELEAWVDYWCDQLGGMFQAMERAAPAVRLGIMVMYMGSEKAGIRLPDYDDNLFRVGELMFSDDSFGPVKGKTDELFSALFHRRFARPELAYSETTAYPSDRLSAPNMAAKLSVSLLADVRNTMFMSGLTPFPATHWETLGPAMAESARLQERIAGHHPRGPLKHFWGRAGRTVGDDQPFSLFLATGIPFEVVDEHPTDGWAFLGDDDARALTADDLTGRATLVARAGRGLEREGLTVIAEDMGALLEFRRAILPGLEGVPYIAEEVPVVLGWYPSAHCAIAWNLTEQQQRITLARDGEVVGATRTAAPLGVTLFERI